MKPTIAEVLHYAADHCLSDDWYEVPTEKAVASCNAICLACDHLGVGPRQNSHIFQGLRRMGLNTSAFNFKTFNPGPEKQGARYAWLKFAALMAEEQGV